MNLFWGQFDKGIHEARRNPLRKQVIYMRGVWYNQEANVKAKGKNFEDLQV